MAAKNYDSIGLVVNYKDQDAKEKLSDYISQFINEKTLIVCVGTDKCIGDSLGPLVGTFLKEYNCPIPVIGTLESPAHAVNLEEILLDISLDYFDYYIIAVDACLGFDDTIGDIQVKLGPVHPGKGVGKILPSVGDISIVGVVDSIDNPDSYMLKNIRLNFIWEMAKIISDSIIVGINKKA